MLNGREASCDRKERRDSLFSLRMTSLSMIKEDRAESARRLQILYNVHALDLYIERIRDMLV